MTIRSLTPTTPEATPRARALSAVPAPPSPSPEAAEQVTLSIAASASAAAPSAGPSPCGLGENLRKIGEEVALAVADTMAGIRLVSNGLLYRAEGKISQTRETVAEPSLGLPTPVLSRPYVMVPGWGTKPKAYDALVSLLTRDGANGGQVYYVKEGQFFTRDADDAMHPVTEPPRQGAVFQMMWTVPHQSPAANLPEFRANIEAICSVTGAEKVDAEGFSMGGLDTRLYIDQGGTRINRFMMLGTPNRGARFGELVLDVLDRDVDWAKDFSQMDESQRETMYWLRQEENNPILQDLNSRFDQQQDAVPTLTVGVDTLPTVGSKGLMRGDGLVAAESLGLPGGTTLVLHELRQHGKLNDDPTVQRVRSLYFGWGPAEIAADVTLPEDAALLAQVPRP